MSPSRLLLGLALVALGGCGDEPATDRPRVLASWPVVRGELAITISPSAALQSKRPMHVEASSPGKIAWAIPEGTQVSKGDKVLELTNEDLKQKLEQAKVEREKTARALETARSELKLHELESGKLIDDDARALKIAEMALAQYVDGKAPLKRQDLRLALERAGIDAADAEEKAARMPDLLDKGFVTSAEKRLAELDAREKAQKREHAARDLEIFDRYEDPQESAKLEGELAAAKLKVERTKQATATQRGQKQSEESIQQHSLEHVDAQIANLEKQLGEMVLTAPGDGVIVYGADNPYISFGTNEKEMNPGKEIYPNQPVMTIPDLSDMVAATAIDGIDVTRVKPGMKAFIHVEGIDETFSGEVLKVADTAKQNWQNGGSQQFEATISLGDTSRASFRPGMGAKVEIVIDRLRDVLSVPIDAVYQREGATYCYVAGEGGRRRPVKVGAGNDDHVVIADGLKEGETVDVYGVEPGE